LFRFALPAAALLLTAAAAPASDDPYLWLEEIEGKRALDQVKQWNKASEDLLTRSVGFEQYRARARAILDDEQQIAFPGAIMGDQVTNLWRDARNPRGIWRISPLAAYAAGKPQWRTLIDVDALGKEEGKSWVWHGADCLAPEYRRCLVSLSPGGTDADVLREFDLATGKFIEGGFTLPEAKSDVSWIDADRLLVVTDYGPESLTNSGYGRVAKIWTRGTPLAQAQTIFTGNKEDVSVGPIAAQDGERRWVLLNRKRTYWTNELLLLTGDGKLVKTPMPQT
jgi:prolyl oligopeptidase